MVSKSYHRYI